MNNQWLCNRAVASDVLHNQESFTDTDKENQSQTQNLEQKFEKLEISSMNILSFKLVDARIHDVYHLS
jgi:hypothetical protein